MLPVVTRRVAARPMAGSQGRASTRFSLTMQTILSTTSPASSSTPGHARQLYSGNRDHRDQGRPHQTPALRPCPRSSQATCLRAVRLLKWLVDRKITPHVPGWDKSTRHEGTFSQVDVFFDQKRNVYIAQGGAELTSTGTRATSSTTEPTGMTARPAC